MKKLFLIIFCVAGFLTGNIAFADNPVAISGMSLAPSSSLTTIASSAASSVATDSSTASPVSTQAASEYLKIFYYKDNAIARASLFKNAKSIDVLAPQAYALNGDGILEGNIDPAVLDFTKKNNIKMMPLVTNKSFGQAGIGAILDDVSKQNAAIKMLIDEAKNKGYWGWQIDFEGMNLSYRDKFSAFIKNFGEQMKNNGLVSSVAVVSEVSEVPSDYPRNLWSRLIGVYDYKAIGESVDFVSLMSYDDPNSVGPISGYSWLARVLRYSMSVIPPEKISLGIPLYYWRWNQNTKKLVAIGGFNQMKNFIRKYRVYFGYSPEEQESFIAYSSGGVKYIIWYEDTKGMAAKIDLIKKYKLNGFSAWVLGLEAPGIYKAI